MEAGGRKAVERAWEGRYLKGGFAGRKTVDEAMVYKFFTS